MPKQCSKCNSSFKTYKELLQHLADVHEISMTYPCNRSDCNFTTNMPSVLRTHKREVHGLTSKRKLTTV